MDRKLAAICSTDVTGDSRLRGDEEEASIRTLPTSREVKASLLQSRQGRVVDAPE